MIYFIYNKNDLSYSGVSAAASSRDEEEEYDDRWGDIYEDAPAR